MISKSCRPEEISANYYEQLTVSYFQRNKKRNIMPKLFLKSSIPCLLIGLPGNFKLILVTILLG